MTVQQTLRDTARCAEDFAKRVRDVADLFDALDAEKARVTRNASHGWGPDADVDEDGADCRNYAEPPTSPQPAVLMYHDLYATADSAAEQADWQRDPEVGAE